MLRTFCIASDSDSDVCMPDMTSSSLKDIDYLYSDATDWVAMDSVCNSIFSSWFDGYDVVQSSYVCLRDDRTWKPKSVSVICHSPFASCFDETLALRHSVHHPLRVCTMSLEDQDVEILIDSGSDATVIPLAFAGCGKALDGNSSLVDCQGNQLHTSELREFSFVMHTNCGKTVRFREVGHVSSSVFMSHHFVWQVIQNVDGELVAQMQFLSWNTEIQMLQSTWHSRMSLLSCRAVSDVFSRSMPFECMFLRDGSNS